MADLLLTLDQRVRQQNEKHDHESTHADIQPPDRNAPRFHHRRAKRSA
jgi:hypothetical protein